MDVQLIASDMDGTLLDPYGKITDVNVAAIKRAQERGIEFMICSGRDYSDARKIMERVGVRCGYICLSGGSIHDIEGNKLSEVALTTENVVDIWQVFTEFKVPADILAAEGRYSTVKREQKIRDIANFFNGGKPLPEIIPKELLQRAMERTDGITFIDDIGILQECHATIYKMLGCELSVETVADLKKAFSSYPDIAAASSFPTNLELTNTMAQKGHALKQYAGLKGISLKSIMTIGDSDNDLTMITPEFGWPIAMENAMDCIKEAAGYQTKSNKENGVAWAIEQYAL